MKYFTEAFSFCGLSDEQCFAAREAYAARIEDIKSQLSPELSELATSTVNLHDGLIRHVALDCPARSLSLGLPRGELQVGYFDVNLIYLNGLA